MGAGEHEKEKQEPRVRRHGAPGQQEQEAEQAGRMRVLGLQEEEWQGADHGGAQGGGRAKENEGTGDMDP